jgi:hypothetical protein
MAASILTLRSRIGESSSLLSKHGLQSLSASLFSTILHLIFPLRFGDTLVSRFSLTFSFHAAGELLSLIASFSSSKDLTVGEDLVLQKLRLFFTVKVRYTHVIWSKWERENHWQNASCTPWSEG